MLSEAILKIENQRKDFSAGSLEDGIAQGLLQLCRESPEAARAIAASDKPIKDCGKKLYAYAQKHKSGNSYFLAPDIAMKLITEFYGIAGDAATPSAPASAPAPQAPNVVNILDFLD